MLMNVCFAPAKVATRSDEPAALTPSHPLRDLDGLADMLEFDRGHAICSEARKSDYWYRIVSGAARRCMVRSDGSQQTLDLLVPGDFFGFHVRDDYGFSVEALAEGTIVARYPRWSVDFLAEAEPSTAEALRSLAVQAISRMQIKLLIGGRMTARAKVSAFLPDMDDRLPHQPQGWFDLPVSRRDIADYLGLSVEAVGLALTILGERGMIALSGPRRMRIVDRGALEESADEIDMWQFGRRASLVRAGEIAGARHRDPADPRRSSGR